MTRRADRSGMTLIEIVVAMAIAAGMFAVAYQVLVGTVHASRLASEGQDAERIGQGVLDLLTRDLTHLPRAEMGPADPPSFEGKADGYGNASLDFLSAADSLFVGDHPEPSDLTEVGYRTEARADGSGFKLYRREQYFADSDRLKGGTLSMLAPHVRSFEVQYRTEGENPEWVKTWAPGQEQKIPKAVRVRLVVFIPPPADATGEEAKALEKAFETVILCKR